MEAFVNMLLTAVVTLGAAFLGAWYAFRLNDSASARQTVRERRRLPNFTSIQL